MKLQGNTAHLRSLSKFTGTLDGFVGTVVKKIFFFALCHSISPVKERRMMMSLVLFLAAHLIAPGA